MNRRPRRPPDSVWPANSSNWELSCGAGGALETRGLEQGRPAFGPLEKAKASRARCFAIVAPAPETRGRYPGSGAPSSTTRRADSENPDLEDKSQG